MSENGIIHLADGPNLSPPGWCVPQGTELELVILSEATSEVFWGLAMLSIAL